MNLAVSPYHLTTREPALMAALLLCDRAVTFLPTPAAGIGRDDVLNALRRSPRYGRFLESWRWTVPLWRAGLITSLEGGEDAIDDVRDSCDRIETDPGLAGVARFMHDRFFNAPADGGPGLAVQPLDLLSADLTKGGPDPGLGVPIAAGLDRLAARHGLISVRAGASVVREGVTTSSLAQRAEALIAPAIVTFALPIAAQAAAQTLLELRADLARPLGALRVALAGAAAGGKPALAREAARACAAALSESLRALEGHDDSVSRQVRSAMVRVTLSRLPIDAAISAASAAARSIRAGKGAQTTRPRGDFLALTVTPMAAAMAAAPLNGQGSRRA